MNGAFGIEFSYSAVQSCRTELYVQVLKFENLGSVIPTPPPLFFFFFALHCFSGSEVLDAGVLFSNQSAVHKFYGTELSGKRFSHFDVHFVSGDGVLGTGFSYAAVHSFRKAELSETGFGP